jgi:hypothetical protein
MYITIESKQAFEKLNCFRAISGNSKKKRLKRGRSVRERAQESGVTAVAAARSESDEMRSQLLF